MRSANEAIGIGSVVGMVLLYVVGGIGVGLFFMLRGRYVLWRQAAIWGFSIGALQTLAAVNEFPLIWMNYDTAVPRSTFLAGQAASLLATLLGFSAFLALSFVAAETLGRKAFGQHPQLWRVWTKGPGSSTAVLGLTAAGYLLVSVFFAYDVALYVIATRYLGWWTPSEALLHPDVLATYVPWLSAIANSLQAGFWEECLFRAVPLAGAALIGDRFGKRNLFLAVAFVVQAVIFGAGHAPYPTQPSFARPVELIIPSIGFGLLYVYFGLLPGIVLHFAFDVVWFALPIFLSDAPGIWLQKLMVIAMTLVPLWVVLYRRWQSGAWTILPAEERNAAWTPPAAAEPEPAPVEAAPTALPSTARTAWIAIGAVSLAVLRVGDRYPRPPRRCSPSAAVGQRISRARRWPRAAWRLDRSGACCQSLTTGAAGRGNSSRPSPETSGERLVGKYLPEARWRVRVATFEGDVAERAEEWRVFVTRSGDVLRVEHTLPEGRAGATLDETAARALAAGALKREFGLDAGSGQVREVSARPAKLKARTDWTFTYADATAPPLPQGELRLEVEIAGDQVTGSRRFVFVPEQWGRQQRATETRNLILRIVVGVVFGGLLVAAAVGGVVSWSRRHYTPRVFFAAAAIMLVATVAAAGNAWPATQAAMPTEIPLALQLLGVLGVGLVALIVTSSLTGLALGAQPVRLQRSGLAERDAIILGCAVGAFAAALQILASAVRTPAWAESTWIGPAGTFVPMIAVAVEPISGLLTRTAVMLSLLTGVHHITLGWTRRRAAGAAIVLLVGFLGAGAPAGAAFGGWIAAGIALAIGLLVAYTTLLRADLTMVPITLGTMIAIGAIARGAQRPFPGALPGSAIAALVALALGWWLFRALRHEAQATLTRSTRTTRIRDR